MLKQLFRGVFQRYKAARSELRRDIIFKRHHGYDLNVDDPVTFTEKVIYRKYQGNPATMAKIADKYRVRELVADTIGEQYLIPLIGAYDSLRDADFDALPDSFVIKSNHGTGDNHIEIVQDKHAVDWERLVAKFDKALTLGQGANTHELFYLEIERKIIIEQYLDTDNVAPDDYKIHCFDGKADFIQLVQGRYMDGKLSMFDTQWNLLPFTTKPKFGPAVDAQAPENFETMLALAEELARDFDYIRVDFYNLDGQIYFGELTQTHGGGFDVFKPTEWDHTIGQRWRIDTENPKLYRTPKESTNKLVQAWKALVR